MSVQSELDDRVPEVYNKIITAEYKALLQKALLRECTRILQEIPPEREYPYWDVYVGFMIGPKTALKIAEEYIDSALASCHATHPSLPIDPSLPAHIENKCGFLRTAVGLYAIVAHVKHHVGDYETSNHSLHLLQTHFARSAFTPRTQSELLYGRAGLLYALKYTAPLFSSFSDNFKLPSNPVPSAESSHHSHRILRNNDKRPTTEYSSDKINQIISSIFDAIIENGSRTASDSGLSAKTPLIWKWHETFYLGAAHGAAGILTVLLSFPDKVCEYRDIIKRAIDFVLFETRGENGNWMSSLDRGKTDLVQFCHGAPGIAFLACRAYEVFKEARYLEIAAEAAMFVHDYGILRKGVGLCHGVSGNAYVFLILFKITNERKYLEWTVEFMDACLQWEQLTKEGQFRVPDRPWSVWEGLGGAVWYVFSVW
ncbi:11704_t:CDS:2 [Paraglomus brasilianum]|uniref:11704_t:CDS:1 n=1 Tax=Paraglomus brasilianum TaxID=144538 RepID=A0A9N9DFW1_9GLOM|nr:11704_t:CDS:2 [Paraglomus brasilianum]